MARKGQSDRWVVDLKPRQTRYAEPDPLLPGHYVRVSPNGAKTYAAVARGPDRKQRWQKIGDVSRFTIEEAREKARKAIKAIKAGDESAPSESFSAVADKWFEREVQKRGLRSELKIKRFLDRMKKEWAGRNFNSIRRIDVAKLLDKIEDQNSARQADYGLAVIRQMANWYAARHETYQSPIVKGMRRWNPKDHRRKRILDDNEMRAVWKHAEAHGRFGAIVRLLLLTAQRLDKVASMRWDDIGDDGVWHIHTVVREKGNAEGLPLPDMALAIIREQKRFLDNPYVFAGHRRARDGKKALEPTYFSSFSKAKAAFDDRLVKNGELLEPWRLHDLRRTARSLLSRAGVRSDHAERVMGHSMPVIEGTYDRHKYLNERGAALAALLKQIELILNPPKGNVVALQIGV